MTTFEEEASKTFEESEVVNTPTSSSTNATSSANATSTAAADVQGLLDGLIVCNVSAMTVNQPTEIAAANDTGVTPTISATIVEESSLTGQSSAENATTTSSANATDFSSNMTSTATANATNTNATSSTEASTAGNADCVTNGSQGNNTSGGNATTTAGNVQTAPLSENGPTVSLDGIDFMPGQFVLFFTDKALVAIDDVDDTGNVDAKMRLPEQTQTAGANDTSGNQTATGGERTIRVIESGTLRTGEFNFDGQTLTAAAHDDGQIKAADDNGASASTMTSDLSDSTSTSNSTSNSIDATSNGSLGLQY